MADSPTLQKWSVVWICHWEALIMTEELLSGENSISFLFKKGRFYHCIFMCVHVFTYLCLLTWVSTHGGQRPVLCVLIVFFTSRKGLHVEFGDHFLSQAGQLMRLTVLLSTSLAQVLQACRTTPGFLNMGAQDFNSVPLWQAFYLLAISLQSSQCSTLKKKQNKLCLKEP